MAIHPVVGRTAGSYHVEAKIGAGGMGEVYRAQDTKLGRVVALKMLPPELSATRIVCDDFTQKRARSRRSIIRTSWSFTTSVSSTAGRFW